MRILVLVNHGKFGKNPNFPLKGSIFDACPNYRTINGTSLFFQTLVSKFFFRQNEEKINTHFPFLIEQKVKKIVFENFTH